MDLRRRALRLSIVAVLLMSFAACGGSSSSGQDNESGAAGEAISLEGLTFDPERIVVAPGTKITWTNEDSVQHTVTSGTKGTQGAPGVSKGTSDKPDGTFDGALDDSGTTFTFTFEEPGTYEYFCRIHGGMTGVIVVE